MTQIDHSNKKKLHIVAAANIIKRDQSRIKSTNSISNYTCNVKTSKPTKDY